MRAWEAVESMAEKELAGLEDGEGEAAAVTAAAAAAAVEKVEGEETEPPPTPATLLLRAPRGGRGALDGIGMGTLAVLPLLIEDTDMPSPPPAPPAVALGREGGTREVGGGGV